MSDLTSLDIAAMHKGLAAGDFTARELTEAHLSAMEKGRILNAFITETADSALAAADAADEVYRQKAAGPLTGIPLGAKDVFATAGERLTAASKILADFRPPYESHATRRLKEQGAVFLGKLNLDEFAMGAANETSAFGPVVSPWRVQGDDRPRTPGGSSGGSSAAVAANLVAAALGTDTAGSIREPAAFTGICGIKPTYGRVSRWGTIALASSLDQAGPMARSVRDCALLLEGMAGHDPRDATSSKEPVAQWAGALSPDLKGKKVGLPKEYRLQTLDAAMAGLWEEGADWLRAAGAEVVEVSLPHTELALPAYYILSSAEASSNLARYDGIRFGLRETPEGSGLDDIYMATRAAGFGDEVKKRLLFGTLMVSSHYIDSHYVNAQRVRRLVAEDFASAFAQCDLLLTPTTAAAAFPLGTQGEAGRATRMANDIMTVPASLAGLPAMSVPAGLDAGGLPLGLQIIGRAFDEQGVFDAARAIEQAAGFTSRPVRWW